MTKKLLIIISSMMLSFCLGADRIYATSSDDINLEVITKEISSTDETQSNFGVSYTKPEYINSGYQTYGTSKPSRSTVWDLKENGRYTTSGATWANNLYTNYNFTGVTKMYVSVTPTSSMITNEMTVKVYKNNLLTDTLISEFTAKYETGKTIQTVGIISGLDSSAKYYVVYVAPAYFNGYVADGE